MSSSTEGRGSDALLLECFPHGISVVAPATPLRRLNYFDGKFLRAEDCVVEQRWVQTLVALSNQAGGVGVAYGFDTTLGREAIAPSVIIGRGLAIGFGGEVLYLPQQIELTLQKLIERWLAVDVTPPRANGDAARFVECTTTTVPAGLERATGPELYVLAIGRAEALCGEENVYGRACEEGCVAGTDRPYRLDGVGVRVRPLTIETEYFDPAVDIAAPTLRSRIASAYFARERDRAGSLISAPGLAQPAWCLGPKPMLGDDLPIAVIARAPGGGWFLDPWIVRRERMEPQPRRYWAGVTAARPWDVFLAQVLQFQCHLRDSLPYVGEPGGVADPCPQLRKALTDTARKLAELQTDPRLAADAAAAASPSGGAGAPAAPTLLSVIAEAEEQANKALQQFQTTAPDLVPRGILELPPAGYLPIARPPTSWASVQDQVRAQLGNGLDLRFCIVRPDEVPLALADAQHMDRISLTIGRTGGGRKPEVDILVPMPDGEWSGKGTGIEPTLDWVLFRRRRKERCLGDVVTPTECHTVYRLDPEDPEVQEELKKIDPNLSLLIDRAGSALAHVPFAPDDSIAEADARALKEAWDAAGNGTRVAAYVFSTTDDSQRDRDRGDAIVAALSAVGRVRLKRMDKMPADDCPVVTMLVPAVVCYEVFELTLEAPHVDVATHFTPAALAGITSVPSLGKIYFDAGTDTVAGHPSVTARTGPPTGSLHYFVQGNLPAPSHYQEQVIVIARHLNVDPDEVHRLQVMPDLRIESKCPVIALLVTRRP